MKAGRLTPISQFTRNQTPQIDCHFVEPKHRLAIICVSQDPEGLSKNAGVYVGPNTSVSDNAADIRRE